MVFDGFLVVLIVVLDDFCCPQSFSDQPSTQSISKAKHWVFTRVLKA